MSSDRASERKAEYKMKVGNIKRITGIIIIICMMLACAACGSKEGDTASATERQKEKDANTLQIVTTIFPEYDWVREILGTNPAGAELTLLLDSGTDLHSYQPTAEDIMRISKCDLFIYVGGESDKWVDDALKEKTNQNMIVIDLMDVLGDNAKEEELVEGMQGEEDEHEHEDADHEDADHEDAEHDHDHEEGSEYDEHVWLSLKNAVRFVDVITEKLAGLDAANAETYRANAKKYTESLNKLDGEYKAAVDGSKKTILFGDRFPFRYMVEDYGLDYYAAFIGCSAETEASFETITFLAGKVDELGLRSIFVLEGNNLKIAETIKSNTKTKDQKILAINSMQGITSANIEEGAKYLTIMEENLKVLKEGLQY